MAEVNRSKVEEHTEIEIGSIIEQKTEDRAVNSVREKLAIRLTLMVGVAVVATIGTAAAFPANTASIKDVAVPMIQNLLVVYGMVIAYYFGASTKR